MTKSPTTNIINNLLHPSKNNNNNKNHILINRWFGTKRGGGSRGGRGRGWLLKYRSGLGGRHLQGQYHFRDVTKSQEINDMVFDLNQENKGRRRIALEGNVPTLAYLDFAIDGWRPKSSDTEVEAKEVEEKEVEEKEVEEGEDLTNEEEDKAGSDNKELYRIKIELASAALPMTCRNFAALCAESGGNGDDGSGGGQTWGYKSTMVHRIEKGVGICMGDVLGLNGDGGRCHPSISQQQQKQQQNGTSIVCDTPFSFSDESFVLSHSSPGIVSMLSTGSDRNDSRFMITTSDAPHLDGKFVAFGRVVEGLDFLLEMADGVFTQRGRPLLPIQIVDCGTL